MLINKWYILIGLENPKTAVWVIPLGNRENLELRVLKIEPIFNQNVDLLAIKIQGLKFHF